MTIDDQVTVIAKAQADAAVAAHVAKYHTPPPTGSLPGLDAYPGWKRTFADDFLAPCLVGQFAATYPNFGLYLDGWGDTNGKGGAPSIYMPSKVLSVRDSFLVKSLHVENGVPM